MVEKPSQNDRLQTTTSTRNERSALSTRRSYLRGSSVALASIFGIAMMGHAGAATARHGIQFDTVIDAVDDLGCDPTGEEPCHEQIDAGAQDGALIYFPEGDYKIAGNVVLYGLDTAGMYSDTDATFVVPENTQPIIAIRQGGTALFEGIDVDMTAHRANEQLTMSGTERVHVEDVQVHGHHEEFDSASLASFKLVPLALESSAEGLVKDFVATDGGAAGTYKNGGGGMWAGPPNKGRLQFVDCNIQGHPNNGLYAGRSEGPIQIKGGLWKNNEVSQVRLSGADSFVRNADIVVDDERETLNQRGVWWDGAKQDKTGGEIRNCNIQIRNANKSQGAIRVWATAGACTVKNTHIRVNESRTEGQTVPALHAEAPNGGPGFAPPPEPHSIMMKNVTIEASNEEQQHEGDEATGSTVSIIDRPGSTVKNTCIRQTGADRNGITFLRSDGTVRNSTIDVSGEQIATPNSEVEIHNLREKGGCAPRGGGANRPPSE